MNQLNAFVAVAAIAVLPLLRLSSASADPIKVDQGPNWTEDQQAQFYVLDQGSRLMPLRWFKALRHADGSRFADGLARYGYLANPKNPAKLPVGFSAAGTVGNEVVGLTCAACHTRDLDVGGARYRIDGGPALIDFQAFLTDIDDAVTKLLDDAGSFDAFANEVVGADDTVKASLRQTLSDWHARNSILTRQSLNGVSWGPGRLDAVAMIMNRVTGLGLGEPPHYLIADNIKPADAPVRYPFLWNTGHQDRTQWSGFAPNRDRQAALVRNIGQVLGVFGEYRPRKNVNPPPPGPELITGNIDFITGNSANLTGLFALEGLMRNIGPPRWPWPIDQALADKGEEIYRRTCDGCHAMNPGTPPWHTPVTNAAGTDTRQLTLLGRPADPGVLLGVGARILQVPPLKNGDRALDVLRVSALGSAIRPGVPLTVPPVDTPPRPGYEARVLHGIWAAAPYLHNGSVPTLAALLEPPDARPPSFQVGPTYDREKVGLAVQQEQKGATLFTTDCSDLSSGNSRCGHAWGTDLPPEDKRALLEYLKRL